MLGDTDFTIHLEGKTGSFKTQLTALVMQHFGADFYDSHLPSSWHSTANYNEELGFTVKDGILVIDDYAPTGERSHDSRLRRDADTLVRNRGNSAGRGRLNRNSTIKQQRPSRALQLTSGEDTFSGAGIAARCLVIGVVKGEVNSK